MSTKLLFDKLPRSEKQIFRLRLEQLKNDMKLFDLEDDPRLPELTNLVDALWGGIKPDFQNPKTELPK